MALPFVALQDPNSGFTAAITSTGQLQVTDVTINVTAVSVQLTSSSVTISGGSVVVTNASVTGSVSVTGGSVQIIGGASAGALATSPVSNVSVAATTGFTSVKVGTGRLFGITVVTSGAVPLTVTDGSAGTPIFAMSSIQTSAPGYFGVAPAGNQFNTALVLVGNASNPSVVVHFS